MLKKVVVLGGGPGGYVAAIRAAQLNAQVSYYQRTNIRHRLLSQRDDILEKEILS